MSNHKPQTTNHKPQTTNHKLELALEQKKELAAQMRQRYQAINPVQALLQKKISITYKEFIGQNPDFFYLVDKMNDEIEARVGNEKRLGYHTLMELTDNHRIVMAFAGVLPVGCVSYFVYDEENKIIDLDRVYVDDRFRGMGIAKHLINRLTDIARREGYKGILLETYDELYEAVRLYEESGWERKPDMKMNANSPHSCVMEKNIGGHNNGR